MNGNVTDVDFNISSDDHQQKHSPLYTVLRGTTNTLDMFLVPTLVAMGVMGNTLSFVTFTFSNLKSLSSSVYLAALAIADIGFLLCVLASWITNFNVNLYHQPGWCQTFVYLTYVFSFLSVWYVVGFTVERYIAVRFPFKRGDMCTVRRARIVVVGLSIFSTITYNFAIWTTGSFIMPSTSPIAGQRLCYPKDSWREVLKIANNFDSVVTLAIPFFVIAILNAHIIYAVTRYQREANEMVIYRSSATASATSSTANTSSNTRESNKVTRMLLVVSFTFLLLNVPGHVIRFHVFVQTMNDPLYKAGPIYYELQKLFVYLYYVNFSINFFLYSLCGKNFRVALKSLLINCCTKYGDDKNGFRLHQVKRHRETHSVVTKTVSIPLDTQSML